MTFWRSLAFSLYLFAHFFPSQSLLSGDASMESTRAQMCDHAPLLNKPKKPGEGTGGKENPPKKQFNQLFRLQTIPLGSEEAPEGEAPGSKREWFFGKGKGVGGWGGEEQPFTFSTCSLHTPSAARKQGANQSPLKSPERESCHERESISFSFYLFFSFLRFFFPSSHPHYYWTKTFIKNTTEVSLGGLRLKLF